MTRTLLFIGVGLILFAVLYDLYKTRSYKKPRQIVLSIVGALILIYVLYTCESDN